jgi:hypothetical protein
VGPSEDQFLSVLIGIGFSPLCVTKREFCSGCNVVTSSCCILGIRWDIKGEALG